MPRSPNSSPATITRGLRSGISIPNDDAVLVIQAMLDRNIPYDVAIRESDFLYDNGIYSIQFYEKEKTIICFFGRQYQRYELPLKSSVPYNPLS